MCVCAALPPEVFQWVRNIYDGEELRRTGVTIQSRSERCPQLVLTSNMVYGLTSEDKSISGLKRGERTCNHFVLRGTELASKRPGRDLPWIGTYLSGGYFCVIHLHFDPCGLQGICDFLQYGLFNGARRKLR